MASTILKFLILFCLCSLLIGCTNSEQNNNIINYDELPELQTNIVEDIRESDDFIPGRLRELIIDSMGSIIVSDWGKMAIEQFDSTGNYLGEIASGGEGPGELSTFFSLFHSYSDTLLISYLSTGGQIDIFVREKDGIRYQYKETVDTKRHEFRHINLLGNAPGGGYFAKAEELIQNRQKQLFNPELKKDEPLLIVNEALEVLFDSVEILSSPNVIFTEAGGNAVTPIGTSPFLYADQVRTINKDQYMIAKPDEASIQIRNQYNEIVKQFDLEVEKRPVLNTDLDNELRNIPEEFRSILIEKAPDVKPAFKNAWVENDKIWLHTDKNDKVNQVVVLTGSGKAIGKFYLSEFDEINSLKNDHIYTIHKNPEMGHSIRIYRIDI